MKQSPSSASRRQFMKTAATTAAATIACPYIITSAALGNETKAPASDRIVMGGIGIGNQGSSDQNDFLNRGDVQYVAVCDVRKSVRENKKNNVDNHNHNKDCQMYNDFRELLARGDIDAIHCGTPDHWHAIIVIEACRNGKDVYCQKPESRTIREGRLMVEAARRYGRVVSGGSQRVHDDYGGVAAECWSGKKGKIKEIYVNCGGPSKPCYLAGQPVPADLDWDMWLGPAPWAPYHEYRCSGSFNINGTSWRSFSDYSGGGMTDWGAHKFGGAMFAGDVRDQGPTDITPPDGKDVKYLTYKFPSGLLIYHSEGKQGTDVTPVGDTSQSVSPKTLPGYKGQGGIHGDFIECVKTRERPFRDIEFAHRTATVCHLGNIAYELKRPLKWDATKEEFPGDEEANRYLDRARRDPWQL